MSEAANDGGIRLRVAILDSGVNPNHRQVGFVAGGVRIHLREGRLHFDERGWEDGIGHGTAVAAAVSEGVPAGAVALLSVRVFDRRLEAPAACLAAGIRWAAENGAQVANLSAGVVAGSDPAGEREIRSACLEACGSGLTLIAPRRSRGDLLVPGALPGVSGLIGVEADVRLERGMLDRRGPVLIGSPWARPLPPLPRERNFSGVSLAVAGVTNRAIRLLLTPGAPGPEELSAALLRSAGRGAAGRTRPGRAPSG